MGPKFELPKALEPLPHCHALLCLPALQESDAHHVRKLGRSSLVANRQSLIFCSTVSCCGCERSQLASWCKAFKHRLLRLGVPRVHPEICLE